jgi:glycosyltransferase involved in cell wall biosynthesis
MVQYGAPTGLPLLYDAHNVESELVRRYAPYASAGSRTWAAQREWRLLRTCERHALGRASVTIAASEVDAGLLRRLAPKAIVEAVPLAMEISSLPRIRPLTAAAELLHLGGLHWPPNADAAVHFATAILPLVRKRRPDVRLTIVGRATSSQAHRLARHPRVHVFGRVENLDDIWRRSRVLVVPLRSGSGVRVKILEAFARGVPVVSTSVGCEGLDVDSGVHLAVADRPADFAEATIALLADDNRAEALSDAARAHVASRHDVGIVGPRLLDVVRRAAEAQPSIGELVR